jgi:hypothetical protein
LRQSCHISVTPTTTHASELGLPAVWQTHHIFRRLDIRPERDTRGFFGYVFIYQGITSAAALRGYWQYLRGGRRHWR